MAQRIELALAEAEVVPPGADGLRCLPQYRGGDGGGEGEGVWAGAPAGTAFLGLQRHHRPGHLVRAGLEGLAAWLGEAVASIEAAGGLASPASVAPLLLTGGAAWPLHAQIIADMLRRPVRLVQLQDEAAVGAALLAGIGVGIFSSMEAAAASISRDERLFSPQARTS